MRRSFKSAPVVPVADARRTRDGAVITFKGAGNLPAAVFVRGLTAWVVLENAPAFDSGNLKPALGDFAAGIARGGLGARPTRRGLIFHRKRRVCSRLRSACRACSTTISSS